MRALLFSLCAAAGLLACGDDPVQRPPDASPGADAATDVADAMPVGSNALGQACDEARPCPTERPHVCVFLSSGNPEVGYCSPVCEVDADCVAGYEGPQTGDVRCFVPDQPNVCSIGCEVEADCPEDLSCVETGGPVRACATE